MHAASTLAGVERLPLVLAQLRRATAEQQRLAQRAAPVTFQLAHLASPQARQAPQPEAAHEARIEPLAAARCAVQLARNPLAASHVEHPAALLDAPLEVEQLGLAVVAVPAAAASSPAAPPDVGPIGLRRAARHAQRQVGPLDAPVEVQLGLSFAAFEATVEDQGVHPAAALRVIQLSVRRAGP